MYDDKATYRWDLTQFVLASLANLGYSESFKTLLKESQTRFKSLLCEELKETVCQGNFDIAIKNLESSKYIL